MPNPFEQIEDALKAKLLLVEGLGWAETYDGQEPAEMAAHLGQKAGRPGAYVRVFGGGKDQESSKTRDDADTLVHIIICATSNRSRRTAAKSAKELLWNVYKALRGDRLNLAWLFCGLQFRDWETLSQTSQSTIVSLIMAVRFDMNEWA